MHSIHKAIKSKKNTTRHKKKTNKSRQQQQHMSTYNYHSTYLKHTVRSMSSYELSNEENAPLSLGLHHHITTKTDYNLGYNEFEAYYESILDKVTNLGDTKISHLKTNIRSPCEKDN